VETALKASQLKKVYQSRITTQEIVALNGVDLTVGQGEIFAILGPNGAGKTTLLNCLSLLLQPDQGEISIFGLDVRTHSREVRRRINMSSGNSNFPWCMTVREILFFYGSLYGLWGQKLKDKIDELIVLLELGPMVQRQFEELSTGSKQKLSLAKALLNSPEILFLDEPTIGLDPHIAIQLRSFIQKMNKDKKMTVLLTTHYMKEAEELAHRVAFLQKGQILTMGTPEELKKRSVAKNMEEVFLQLNVLE